jgi:hypothetical protein
LPTGEEEKLEEEAEELSSAGVEDELICDEEASLSEPLTELSDEEDSESCSWHELRTKVEKETAIDSAKKYFLLVLCIADEPIRVA